MLGNLKLEEGAMNQGMQALEVQKTQENVLPPEPPEETQCC